MIYLDDDGTTDVNFTDRNGQGWMWYRAVEGEFRIPVRTPGEEIHPLGNFAYGNLRRPMSSAMRGTGVLTPPSFPSSPFFDFAPWYARVIEPDVLMGRRGVAGWDGVSYDRSLWLTNVNTDDADPAIDMWDWTLGMFWGAVKTVVIVGGTIVVLGLISAIPGVGVPIAIAVGATMLAYMVGSSAANRLEAGQSGWSLVGGVAADVTGVSGIYAGITNKDIATGQYLGLSSEQMGEAFGGGVVQLAGLAYGGFRIGQAGVGFARNLSARNAAPSPTPGQFKSNIVAGDPMPLHYSSVVTGEPVEIGPLISGPVGEWSEWIGPNSVVKGGYYLPKLPLFTGKPCGFVVPADPFRSPFWMESGGRTGARHPYVFADGHVETLTAVVMKEQGIVDAFVYHNHPKGTCPNCNNFLPTFLDEGSVLTVVPPEEATPPTRGWIAKPKTYIGNARSAY